MEALGMVVGLLLLLAVAVVVAAAVVFGIIVAVCTLWQATYGRHRGGGHVGRHYAKARR